MGLDLTLQDCDLLAQGDQDSDQRADRCGGSGAAETSRNAVPHAVTAGENMATTAKIARDEMLAVAKAAPLVKKAPKKGGRFAGLFGRNKKK